MDALIALPDVRAVTVTGADRLTYLDAVLTQRLAGAEPGIATAALHLDVHGDPLAVMDVAVLDDRVVLVAEAEVADEIVRVLGGRTFLSDARFDLGPEVVARLRGVDAHGVADKAGLDVASGIAADRGELLLVGSGSGVDLVGGPGAVESAVVRLVESGADRVGPDELEAWAIAHGVPAWGHEIAPGNLPEELGLLPTHVHLAKGCYPGQEAVARMWQLGRPRRRLAVVAADRGIVPGWEVGERRSRARVTRVAERPDGGRVALALVPEDAVPGDRFEDPGGVGVEVRQIVGAGLDVPGHDPGVARRRDRR